MNFSFLKNDLCVWVFWSSENSISMEACAAKRQSINELADGAPSMSSKNQQNNELSQLQKILGKQDPRGHVANKIYNCLLEDDLTHNKVVFLQC